MSVTKTVTDNLLKAALVIAIGCGSWALPWGISTSTAIPFGSRISAIAFPSRSISSISISQLPIEAQQTIRLIDQGGPFPYRQDGTIFGNREGRLPLAARGTYREYTVRTPGARDRGARRIITGKKIKYYTPDHYRSFQQVRE
jgi:ribonuclease T1